MSMMMSIVSSLTSIGYPQIHSPFVHGMVLGPIANPVILLSSRFERKLLPERCGPATVATAICLV